MLSDLYDYSAWFILLIGLLIFGFFFGLFIIGEVIYSISYWAIKRIKRNWNTIFTTRM